MDGQAIAGNGAETLLLRQVCCANPILDSAPTEAIIGWIEVNCALVAGIRDSGIDLTRYEAEAIAKRIKA